MRTGQHTSCAQGAEHSPVLGCDRRGLERHLYERVNLVAISCAHTGAIVRGAPEGLRRGRQLFPWPSGPLGSGCQVQLIDNDTAVGSQTYCCWPYGGTACVTRVRFVSTRTTGAAPDGEATASNTYALPVP